MRNICLIVVLFFLCLSFAHADNDSLKIIANNAKTIKEIDGVNRLLLNTLESRYLPTDIEGVTPDFATYAEKMLQLSKTLKHKKGEVEAIFILGLYYWHLGLNYQTSIDQKSLGYFEQASVKAKGMGYSQIDAKANRSIGKIYVELGELQIGLKNLLEVYDLNQIVEGRFYLVTDIGNIYFDSGEYLKALQKFLEALVIARNEKNNHRIAYGLNNVARAFDRLARRSKAITNLDEGIAIAEQSKDNFCLALLYNTYGGLSFRLDETDKAINYYQQALKISEELNNPLLIANISEGFAQLYGRKKEYAKALEFYEKSLQILEKSSPKIRLIETYSDLSDIYNSTRDYQKSLKYFKLYTELKERYLSEQSQKAVASVEEENIAGKIELLEKTTKLVQAELQTQKLIRNVSLGVVAVAVIGIAFLLYNYNQKRKANKELVKQKEELKQANVVKDRMFAVVSQDLRNPLNSLRNVVTLLNSGALNSEEIKLISEKLNQDLGDTLGLLDNLLYWARSQMQGIKREPNPINVHQLTNDNITLLSGSASKKGVTFHNLISQSIKAQADFNMISLVIRNLLTNAVKFSPKGGNISVNAKINGEMIEVSVSDNGTGMSYEQQQKLFNTNAVLGQTGTAMEKGSGLGLLLCKEFIEENGGKIWVDTKEGKGSTFTFSLHLAK
jgi:two-component system, sensor histidine kinase and response regulator